MPGKGKAKLTAARPNRPAWANRQWMAQAQARAQALPPQQKYKAWLAQQNQKSAYYRPPAPPNTTLPDTAAGQKASQRNTWLAQARAQPGYSLEQQAWDEEKRAQQNWAKLQTPGGSTLEGLQPTSTILPDTFAAQREASRSYIRPPWWSSMLSPQRQMSRQVYRDRGPIAKPKFVSPKPTGYTEGLGSGGQAGGGIDWGGYGGGGSGYSYPDYNYGGGGAYAQPLGRGYNPADANTPRWWHNRLSWRF